jgi:hypothetical protein
MWGRKSQLTPVEHPHGGMNFEVQVNEPRLSHVIRYIYALYRRMFPKGRNRVIV